MLIFLSVTLLGVLAHAVDVEPDVPGCLPEFDWVRARYLANLNLREIEFHPHSWIMQKTKVLASSQLGYTVHAIPSTACTIHVEYPHT